MKSENGNNSSINEQISQILHELKLDGNFQGVLLSFRNGEPIYNVFDDHFKDINEHELSSMCASVLEGTSTLSKVIGEDKLTKIVAELNSYMIIIVQCDKNVFLVFIADHNSYVSKVLDSIEKYQKKIILSY